MAYWLGFQLFTAVARVQSLVGKQIPQAVRRGQKKKRHNLRRVQSVDRCSLLLS